jgi:hypothetical protein
MLQLSPTVQTLFLRATSPFFRVGVAVLSPSGCALLLLGAFVIFQADIVIQRLFPRSLVERSIQQIIE